MERELHPACTLYPAASTDDLNALAVDIVRNGLMHPIVVTPDGKVIDGRNRLAACALVNVEPTFEVYEGDPWKYALSCNSMGRKGMTTGQHAAVVALNLAAQGLRRNGRWARGSIPGEPGDGGVDTGRSSSSDWIKAMSQAGVVLDWSTPERDLIGMVRDGRLALDAAYKRALDAKSKAEWEADQKRKAREAQLKEQDAELGQFLSIQHQLHELDLEKCNLARDVDYWRATQGFIAKTRKMLDKLERMANEHLAQ